MKRTIQILFGAAVLVSATTAMAGAYQLNDYSVTGLGRSYAGQGIMGDDYSAIAFNPAGMTLMKKSGMQTGASLINLRADVEGAKLGNKDYAGKHKKMDFWAPIPNLFGQYNVNDRFSVGLGVYAPYGLKTLYDSDWFASDTAVLSKLDIIDFNLGAAYKLNDQWSVGAGVIARYIYGHMTNSLNSLGGGTSDFELDGWTRTGILGVMYEPTKETRFGLSYRLRSTQQVKGDHKIENNPLFNETATGWASPALPETVTFSAYHKHQKYGLSGTARWTHWSQSFPEFVMRSDSFMFRYLSQYPAVTGISDFEKRSLYKYRNSWTLTTGLDYYYNQNWTFRWGTGWDESPTHNNTDRTIRIPDNDRFWLSTGASFMCNTWQVDLGYAFMIGRSGKALEMSDPQAVPVKYKNLRSHILGVQYQYKF